MMAATTGTNVGFLSNLKPLLNLSLGFNCEKPRLGRNAGGNTMRAVKYIQQLLRDDHGATAIEYGMIVALVCLACIGALQSVADENTGLWARVKNQIDAVM